MFYTCKKFSNDSMKMERWHFSLSCFGAPSAPATVGTSICCLFQQSLVSSQKLTIRNIFLKFKKLTIVFVNPGLKNSIFMKFFTCFLHVKILKNGCMTMERWNFPLSCFGALSEPATVGTSICCLFQQTLVLSQKLMIWNNFLNFKNLKFLETIVNFLVH